jgi:hypothetical protein
MIDKIKNFFNNKNVDDTEKMRKVSFLDKLKVKEIEFKNKNFAQNKLSYFKEISLVISAIVLVFVRIYEFFK